MFLLSYGVHPLNISLLEVSWDKIITKTLLLRAFILLRRVRHIKNLSINTMRWHAIIKVYARYVWRTAEGAITSVLGKHFSDYITFSMIICFWKDIFHISVAH